MGLFSKIIDYVTGGSAEVNVEINNATLSEPFPIKVTARVMKNDIVAEKVYVLVRCIEKKQDKYMPVNEKEMTDNEKILREMNEWESSTLYKNEILVAPKSVLKKGETYKWEINMDLRGHNVPTLTEESRKIIWEIQGALGVPGNDPDSGWMEVEVTP